MPPVPPGQCAPPYGGNDYGNAHLTMEELAERWRRKKKTISRNYQRWGLRPLRFGGGSLLFPITQVQEAEERAARGELA